MTPPMNEDGTAYVVPVWYSQSHLELTPEVNGEVSITLRVPDHAEGEMLTPGESLFVPAHTLVRAAVAAAVDALEDLRFDQVRRDDL